MKTIKFSDDNLAEAIYNYVTINYEHYSSWCQNNAFNDNLSMTQWILENNLDDFKAYCKKTLNLEVEI